MLAIQQRTVSANALMLSSAFSTTGKSSSTGSTKLVRAPSIRQPALSGLGSPAMSIKVRTAKEAVSNLLYNEPFAEENVANPSQIKHRVVFTVLVDNEAGVLSKVSGLLASRGFNIETLTVSSTDVKSLSRMTIVLNCSDMQIEQAQRQLEELVEVWAVVNLTKRAKIERELLVIKLDCIPPSQRAAAKKITEAGADANAVAKAQAELDAHDEYELDMAKHFHRHSILEITQMFGGKIADIGSEHLIIEMVAPPKRIDAFLQLVQPFGIIEAARSGVIAMQRAKVNPFNPDADDDADANKDDDLILPPS